MKILVTGGAGYIGSHTVLELLNEGHDVIVVDNLCNSSVDSLERIKLITNRDYEFIKCDIRDERSLNKVFDDAFIDAVIHFAGLKAVGESYVNPYLYYSNNVSGTINLINIMKNNDVNKMIFSSSATVYGEEADVPYKEETKLGNPSSPYGSTKLMIEKILIDAAKANKNFKSVSLRYFNPIGAHKSGMIGEDPLGTPNNLLPFITQVAIGKRKELQIFGKDYPTIDGTCRRDYLHVVDLAKGHVSALNWLIDNKHFHGSEAFNLGTGCPLSVLEILRKFEDINQVKIPYKFVKERDGDLPEFWADVSKASNVLGWTAKKSIDQMLADAWLWQSENPNGYRN